MANAGFAVHAHAIGDRAVRVAVDVLEEAKRLNPAGQHSIAHAQLIHPDEQARIGAAQLAVVFTHAWTVINPAYDLSVIPFFEPVRGRDLYRDSYYMRNVYPTRGILAAGGIVASGSDAPVEDRNPRPFHNLEQAITRANPAGAFPGALNAAQQLDVFEAIASCTIDAARVLGMENEIGSLELGKKADMIVLDQNIVGLAKMGEAMRIGDTRVEQVVFDGREILVPPVPATDKERD
jgi:predicted amidohydrolase YtcJ